MKNNIILTTKPSLKERFILFLFNCSKNSYRIFFKRNKKSWAVSIPKLLAMPDGTLGKDLALFLTQHGFELEPKFEKHDIYHILTDYPTTVIGEVSLSVFNVANGKRSLYTLGVAWIGVLIMIDEFEIFRQAYQRGKNARSYAKWKFEHLLNENTEELKKYIFRAENDFELLI